MAERSDSEGYPLCEDLKHFHRQPLIAAAFYTPKGEPLFLAQLTGLISANVLIERLVDVLDKHDKVLTQAKFQL
jgi:hypothetical protein